MGVIEVPFKENLPAREDRASTTGPPIRSMPSVQRPIAAPSVEALSSLPKAPNVTRVGSLGGQRLRVVAPFEVVFRTEEARIVAEALEIDEFGFGESPSEALTDLQRAITELYVSLRHDRHRLGPDLERVWAVLQQKIAPAHDR